MSLLWSDADLRGSRHIRVAGSPLSGRAVRPFGPKRFPWVRWLYRHLTHGYLQPAKRAVSHPSDATAGATRHATTPRHTMQIMPTALPNNDLLPLTNTAQMMPPTARCKRKAHLA
ncbi:MAG: hypothetical protein ACI4A8_08505 [Muribaculaceae bacterium]